MLTTMHWAPNRLDASLMKSGSRTAALLTLTLSAPAFSRARTSSHVRTPPPTVRGMWT